MPCTKDTLHSRLRSRSAVHAEAQLTPVNPYAALAPSANSMLYIMYNTVDSRREFGCAGATETMRTGLGVAEVADSDLRKPSSHILSDDASVAGGRILLEAHQTDAVLHGEGVQLLECFRLVIQNAAVLVRKLAEIPAFAKSIPIRLWVSQWLEMYVVDSPGAWRLSQLSLGEARLPTQGHLAQRVPGV